MTIHSVTTSSTDIDLSRASKRERILRAAVEVFARTGYFNAKVSEVAKAAGVADGTIYLYFQSKEELLITIFREHTRSRLDESAALLATLDEPREKIARFIQLHFETLGRDRSLAIVYQVELRHSLKFMTLFTHLEFAEYMNQLRAIIEEGQRRGSFRGELNPQLAAKAIFGILDEMVTSWILSEKEYVLETQAAAVAEIVLRGIA